MEQRVIDDNRMGRVHRIAVVRHEVAVRLVMSVYLRRVRHDSVVQFRLNQQWVLVWFAWRIVMRHVCRPHYTCQFTSMLALLIALYHVSSGRPHVRRLRVLLVGGIHMLVLRHLLRLLQHRLMLAVHLQQYGFLMLQHGDILLKATHL